MAQRNPVVWFEIPAADLDRATRFYERVLGVTMQRFEMGPLLMSWFPMAEGAPGAAGTLIHNEAYTPSHEGTLIYISVDDIDAAIDPAVRPMVDDALRITAVGSPASVREQLAGLIDAHRPDEVILTGHIHDHDARLRSFEIGAEAMRELANEQPSAGAAE